MEREIIERTGTSGGPTSIVMAGVHGNEKCGPEAFAHLLPTLQIESGRVLFVLGNPRAIEKNVRATEANLNRMFKSDDQLSVVDKNSYEYSRAQFLKTYLDQADALLDVHASYTPNSRPFVICEPNASEIVGHLPVELVVSGFDAVEPGGTDYYMNSQGKIGICIECGYLGGPLSAETAIKGIRAFLQARGHLSSDAKMRKQSYLHMYDLYFTQSDAFKLARPFLDFESVAAGELIGMDGETEIRTCKESVILFARENIARGDEAFLLGEYKSSLT